ncbi:hypothetical protein ABB37_04716 [Leptomonas pyrrhocoris]|uniref:Uncharacterized protein n=1 Tax=Leptomonas pyrrhocoris TaxID=157538 RepID=A0A0M9G1I9_LEPPY|nr:hypothetical protein ABB37_04716 [Leptomonas pyrrhocoris]KPA80500.1 hypothetical protein ABB37_04716 [Leptomonas pyrrhocoris]|eukprot:XP_015658939.1 hypothetical protein ABB37_04716 [Leptomonas pyrrhocoris]
MASANASEMPSVLQTTDALLDIPSTETVWSAWYKESEDTFADFKSFEPAPAAGGAAGGLSRAGSVRTLSMRQISGQFEEEVAKSWEEDWEDEDVEDTFDHIMGEISQLAATQAATQ